MSSVGRSNQEHIVLPTGWTMLLDDAPGIVTQAIAAGDVTLDEGNKFLREMGLPELGALPEKQAPRRETGRKKRRRLQKAKLASTGK